MADWDGEDRRAQHGWHVGKEIPLAVILGLLIQTGGMVWWAATLSSKLDTLNARVIELWNDRYSAKDAAKDGAMLRMKVDDLQRQIDEIKGYRS